MKRCMTGNLSRDSKIKSACNLRAISFVSAIGERIEIIYLFIYGLFKGPLSNSDYAALNLVMTRPNT
jgi:hypothetical protein